MVFDYRDIYPAIALNFAQVTDHLSSQILLPLTIDRRLVDSYRDGGWNDSDTISVHRFPYSQGRISGARFLFLNMASHPLRPLMVQMVQEGSSSKMEPRLVSYCNIIFLN
jgi:hypothetical protein